MISRYEVSLNGVPLSSLYPASIYVSDIAHTAASVTYATNRLMGRQGAYSGKPYITAARVGISFAVREYSTQRRQEVVQDIAAWAMNGGWLETSDRPGQRLYVRCTQYPSVASAMRWTDDLSVQFTAYDLPLWQDIAPHTVTVANGGTGTLYLPGHYKTEVEAVITAGAALGSIALTCGDTSLTLSGLSVPADGTVTISYTEDHRILQIMQGTTSLLDKRTGDDDLIAEPGNNTVGLTTDGAASCVFKVKGVYL